MTILNIEIRRVDEDEDETTEIHAATQAPTLEVARELAQTTAEEHKCIVRLFVIGGDGHLHEPIQDQDFYPVKHWVEQAIDNLPEKLDLVYVDYRDQLSEEQISAALDGDMDKVYDSMDEWISDNQHYSVRQAIEDCLPDEAKSHLDEVISSEEYDRFRETCWERDSSTPFDDLARNTPAVMIRYYLDHDCPDYTMIEDEADLEGAAREIANAAGIEYTEENSKACRNLISNASYGGQLCVLHNTDIQDAIKVRDGGTVVFTDPFLLVYDGMNGSGHDEQISGTVAIRIDDDHPMRHDAGSYSWSDDIAGVVHSAYDTQAEFKAKDNEEVSA